jgi:hypothetical protein
MRVTVFIYIAGGERPYMVEHEDETEAMATITAIEASGSWFEVMRGVRPNSDNSYHVKVNTDHITQYVVEERPE